MTKRQKELREILLKFLMKLKTQGPTENRCGLCDNWRWEPGARWALDRTLEVAGVNVGEWPLFTGSSDYWVPSGVTNVAPDESYGCANNLWDKRTRYGKNRWALVDWLIEQLEELA